eukprot:COSAG06_NODE_19760_length_823_cov_1.359116_1_plen_65_part_10
MSGGAFEINSIPTFNSSGLRPGSTALRLPKMAMPLVDGAEMWEPEQWAELFQASGAEYVVLTAKH